MTSPELGPFRNILDEAFDPMTTEYITWDDTAYVDDNGNLNVIHAHGWTPPPESRHWCDGLDALRDALGDLRAVEALRDFADLYRADFDSARDRLAASWPTADDLLEARRLERIAP